MECVYIQGHFSIELSLPSSDITSSLRDIYAEFGETASDASSNCGQPLLFPSIDSATAGDYEVMHQWRHSGPSNWMQVGDSTDGDQVSNLEYINPSGECCIEIPWRNADIK